MERRSKSIIDEFLHINDYKVCANFLIIKNATYNTVSPSPEWQ